LPALRAFQRIGEECASKSRYVFPSKLGRSCRFDLASRAARFPLPELYLPKLEINMNTNSYPTTKPYICFAAVVACAVLSGAVQAADHEVTVKVAVSTAGLDPSQPAGAREVYRRLQRAARTACGDGDRVGLEPPTSFAGCYEKALGGGVRSAHRPQLSIIYLATHTVRDAATYGIEVPVRLATE
jgi:UrcA family protein